MKNSTDGARDIYVAIIQKNNKGISFIEEANKIIKEKGINTKEFILLEDLIVNDFDNII